MSTKTVSPGITRFEFEDRKGYMVRIKRRAKRVNIWLPDKKHGGKRKALALAKKTYDDLVKKLGPVEPSTLNKITARNTSGAVGVHIDPGYDARWKCYNESYVASWLGDDGKRKKISFAFKRYGKKVAFELACLARQKKLNERDKVIAAYEKSGKSIGKGKTTKKAAKKVTKKAAPKKTAKKVTKKAKKAAPKKKVAKKATKKVAKKKPAKKKVVAKKKVAKKATKKKAAKKRR
ncbi:MAG: pathogenesis-related transcriptional factor and ERF protein [Aureliella sp.]